MLLFAWISWMMINIENDIAVMFELSINLHVHVVLLLCYEECWWLLCYYIVLVCYWIYLYHAVVCVGSMRIHDTCCCYILPNTCCYVLKHVVAFVCFIWHDNCCCYTMLHFWNFISTWNVFGLCWFEVASMVNVSVPCCFLNSVWTCLVLIRMNHWMLIPLLLRVNHECC